MNKIVIYTCITRGYDSLKLISRELLRPNIDFCCFTDNLNCRYNNNWKIFPIPDFAKNLSPVKSQRLIKILPHRCFPTNEYDASLWIDANIVIKKDLTNFFEQHDLSISPLFVNRHPIRTCVYEEEKAILRFKKDIKENTTPQINRYRAENYPKNNGLAETNVLYRNHNDVNCQIMSNTWAAELLQGSHRDQLSFDYACWKTGFKYEWIKPEFKVFGKYFSKKPHRMIKHRSWQ